MPDEKRQARGVRQVNSLTIRLMVVEQTTTTPPKPPNPTPGLNQFVGAAFKKRYGDRPWARNGTGVIIFSSTPNQFAGPSVSRLSAVQTTIKPLDRGQISSLMDDILNVFEKNPGCEEWTNKLLEEMSKSSGYNAGRIRDIIEDFRKDGILRTDGKQSGDGSGNAGYGRDGYLAVWFSYGGKKEETAVTLLHEIIHWAGLRPSKSTSFYSDKAMATAWHKLGVVMSVEQFRSSFPEYVKEINKRDSYDYAESRLAGAANRITCLGADTAVGTLK